MSPDWFLLYVSNTTNSVTTYQTFKSLLHSTLPRWEIIQLIAFPNPHQGLEIKGITNVELIMAFDNKDMMRTKAKEQSIYKILSAEY